MQIIASIHLIGLLLLPISSAILLGAALRPKWRGGAIRLGLALLALSVPAVLFCRSMSPLDFLGPARAVRVPAAGPGYTVVLVQRPGLDFYESYLEIVRADGKLTRLMVDSDADKWWGLHTRSEGTRTAFITGAGTVVASVDFADGTLSGSIDRKTYRLDALNFDRPWSNGG